ncbi:sterol carrier family protein [Aestuariimicrobium sp. Y1814]|uniref:sterol carrier family protein n=1 Tax=Aestuariimicrobium sp. Y1814 TaxID=3418742 RepID=UPI003DA72D39
MAAAGDRTLRRVAAATIDQLEKLLPDDGGRPSVQRPPSTGRAQCGEVLFLLTDALQTLELGTNVRPGTLADHLYDREHSEHVIQDVIGLVTGTDGATALTPQAERLWADLRAALSSPNLPAVVDSLFGTVWLVDYLRGVLIDAVASAVRFRCEVVPAALTEAVRALGSVLAARHPGAVIEVRVPPAVAVQVGAFGEGPRHTRGTPPNVVELEPATFFALATGARTWRGEVAEHRVMASGAQADALARMLPVINLSR